MPATSGAAFIVIQHLAPAHASLLPELVGQHTRMKVVQAQDGEPVEPNCVYVIPPNHYLGIRDGVLYLAEPVKKDGIRMPIDFFFRALAEDRQQRAIGILFSGAGSDGTLGVRAIRGGGGLVIAQDPHTAQFDTMPRSAIATGLVDYVVPPNRMPEALMEYLRHPYVREGESAAVLEAFDKPGSIQNILALVLLQTGCDFRFYKKTTILRRIERRMGLHRIADVARYSDLLSKDAHEVGELLKDLLINVTSFFRDAEAFEELRDKVVRPLVEAKPADEPVRVWVPGCASGEEAYSLTILLMEEIAAARKNCAVQVFATDIDEEALKFGRLGVYLESIVVDVAADRLARFFIRKDTGYQVGEALRKSVVFAVQNLISDPPFSKMDLISCRNLLIYLDAETQAKLTPLFNFALNSGGYLFLGKSEGIGGRSDLFDVVSKKARLFRRLAPAHAIALDSPILPGRQRAVPIGSPGAFGPPPAGFADVIRQALLSHFAASVVLVDQKGQILQFHGQTGKYLNMPSTEPRLNLLEVAKPGVSLHLRSAMHKAIAESKTVVLAGVPLAPEEGGALVRITVAPAPPRGETEPLLAVIFEDVPRPAVAGVELAQPGQSEASETVVRQLEDELKAAQFDLQSSIDDLQSSIEELRVANEEVISSNEELQSTNEELETSKEELQSLNEELVTVNSQLQEKVEQLNTANSDLANLLNSSEIATLFLDNELRIKFFTPAMTRVLNLIPADMGRPLTHLSIKLIDCDLAAEARAVIEGAPVAEKEVLHADGASYFARLIPYRTQMERLDGVVITFVDVTNVRRAEKQLADIVGSSTDAIFAKTLEGTIATWNQAAETIYGYSAAEAIGKSVAMLASPERARTYKELLETVRGGESVSFLETEHVRKDGRIVSVSLSLAPMRDASGRIVGVSTIARDITERKRRDEALRQSEERYRSLFNTMIEGFSIIELLFDAEDKPVDYRFLEVNPAFERQTGLHDVQGKLMRELAPDHEAHWFEIYGKVALTGKPARFENEAKALNRWFDVSAFRMGGPESRKVAILFNDITDRKLAESVLHTTLQRFYVVLSSMYSAVLLVTDQGRVEFANQAFCDRFDLKDAPTDLVGLGQREVLEKIRNCYPNPDEAIARIREIVDRGQPVKSEELAMQDGRACLRDFVPLNVQGKSYGRLWLHYDITERKRAEAHQALMTAVLRMLNRGSGDRQLVISEMLGSIREATGFDAMGLRLRDGDDCPYFEHTGFSDDFLQEENFLCVKGLDGAIVRDAHGRATLECTCGVVLSGRTDPTMPCFTHNGSFWTNRSSELLALAPEDDPRTNPRNRCIHIGYQSVGLFPVRSGDEIIGLLQLNDRREGRFSPESIRFFESLADNIGLGLKRKQAEEALQKTSDELARSNADLEQFAGVISHDLQEPLRTVTGFVQLLKNKYGNRLDAEADGFIQTSLDGAKRMETMIRDLLAYSRIGTRGREPSPTDAGTAFREALDNLHESIHLAGAEITCGELPIMPGDPSQLAQLFQNLLGNAMKFHGEAPPKIHVDACRERDFWHFSVSDNGIGIDPQFQDQIFDVFRRLHTRRKYPGTGIGLAICKRIVERHGGRIWVESQPGEGTTFHFTVPA